MNNTRFSSVKVYKRYCFGAIFSGLLAIGLLGLFAVLAFFPLFAFSKVGESESLINGLDFIFYGIRKFYGALDTHKLDAFAESLATYDMSNKFLGFVVQYHEYVEIALVGILAVAVLLAAIAAIVGLFWILLGRVHVTKLVSTLSKTIFFFYVLFVGLLFLYLFLCNEIFKAGVGGARTMFVAPFFPFLLAGGFLILMILLAITYSSAFKDRVFQPRNKGGKDNKEEKAEFVENKPAENKPMGFNNAYPSYNQPGPGVTYNFYGQSAPAPTPAPAQPSGPSPVSGPSSLPEGLREIGDRSFSRNTSLKDATISPGVLKIGASAFSNCLSLETVTIPLSVKEIGYNCFFNTPKLRSITYLGTVEEWKRIKKGSNWLSHSGANIIEASDGKIAVNNK